MPFYSIAELISQQIRLNKTKSSLGKGKKTDRNSVNEENIYRERDKTINGW